MRDQLIILAGILGLDPASATDSKLLAYNVQGINDLPAFIEYCEDNMNDYSIKYMKPSQKLVFQSKKFKQLEEQTSLPHDTANRFTDNLIKKLGEARLTIKELNNQGIKNPFVALRLNGEYFFTEKEKEALKQLGSPVYVIELFETDKIKEKLVDLFLSKYIKKAKYEALTDNQKKIKKLTQGAAA